MQPDISFSTSESLIYFWSFPEVNSAQHRLINLPIAQPCWCHSDIRPFNNAVSPTKCSLHFLPSFSLHCDNQLSSLTSHYFLQATCGCMKCFNSTLVSLPLLLPFPGNIYLHSYLLKSYLSFQVKLRYHIIYQRFISLVPPSKSGFVFP